VQHLTIPLIFLLILQTLTRINRTRYASDYKRTCLPIPSLCTCYKQAGGSPQNTKTGNNTSYILHCLCQLEATNMAPTKHAPAVMQIKETTSVTVIRAVFANATSGSGSSGCSKILCASNISQQRDQHNITHRNSRTQAGFKQS